MKKMTGMLSFVLMLSLFAYPGFAEEKAIHWKVQGFMPAGMMLHQTFVRLADEVKTVTNGRLVFDVYPGGALVPGNEMAKATSEGVLQAAYILADLNVGTIPVAPMFTSVPGGFDPWGQTMWYENGGGKQLLQEMYDKYGFNVKSYPLFSVGMENFMWSKKPIKTLADLKSSKMRMLPFMGDVLTKHGFSVVNMPAGEIIPNLQRGVIQAAEYSSPSVDRSMGFHEICKYVIVPGVHQPSGTNLFIVNKNAYNSLPADLKVLLDTAIVSASAKNGLWIAQQNIDAVNFYMSKGVKIVRLDQKTQDTLIQWAVEYMTELSAKDAFFTKVWKSVQDYGKIYYPFANDYSIIHK